MRVFCVGMLLTSLLFACSKSSDPSGGPSPASVCEGAAMTEGCAAPDFSGKTQQGTEFKLADQRGKTVVLYFYPKDETSGCTVEAEGFRDDYAALTAKGIVVVGVSVDSLESHQAFAEAHQLPFPLLSDADGSLAAKFGVPVTKVTARQTFVIGKDGVVQKVYRSVTPTGHAREILGLVH